MKSDSRINESLFFVVTRKKTCVKDEKEKGERKKKEREERKSRKDTEYAISDSNNSSIVVNNFFFWRRWNDVNKYDDKSGINRYRAVPYNSDASIEHRIRETKELTRHLRRRRLPRSIFLGN